MAGSLDELFRLLPSIIVKNLLYIIITCIKSKEAHPLPEPDLLVTKFTIPPVRSALLHRSHLLEVLDQSCAVPLTLLVAAAGFGKTTLLSVWASQRTRQVAWVTLDKQDNDPTRFWAYVIAALRHSSSRLSAVGESAEALLHSSQPALLTSALTALINELAALAQDTVVILDDYHLLGEPAIHESLQLALEYEWNGATPARNQTCSVSLHGNDADQVVFVGSSTLTLLFKSSEPHRRVRSSLH